MIPKDRTFVISGGSSGLGLATVKILHQAGAYVAVLDLQDVPQDVKDICGSKVRLFKTDLTNAGEVENAVQGVVEWVRSTKAILGGIVNSAGVASAAKTIDSSENPHSLDLFEFIVSLNLIGTFNLTRLVVAEMVKQDPVGPDGERGIVIMVSSSAAFEGQPGQVAYAASKGAIRSMTLPMTRDLGRFGIRVVTIAPSLFVSPMTDRMSPKVKDSLIRDIVFPKRFGETYEFADMVLWLIQSTYVNGEVFRLSAGGRMPGKL